MKKYQTIFNKISFKEGIDSIPQLEKLFKKYQPSDIIGSLIESLKVTGNAKQLKKRTWNMLFDIYEKLQDDLSSNE